MFCLIFRFELTVFDPNESIFFLKIAQIDPMRLKFQSLFYPIQTG
jgi:hypothetical protein